MLPLEEQPPLGDGSEYRKNTRRRLNISTSYEAEIAALKDLLGVSASNHFPADEAYGPPIFLASQTKVSSIINPSIFLSSHLALASQASWVESSTTKNAVPSLPSTNSFISRQNSAIHTYASTNTDEPLLMTSEFDRISRRFTQVSSDIPCGSSSTQVPNIHANPTLAAPTPPGPQDIQLSGSSAASCPSISHPESLFPGKMKVREPPGTAKRTAFSRKRALIYKARGVPVVASRVPIRDSSGIQDSLFSRISDIPAPPSADDGNNAIPVPTDITSSFSGDTLSHSDVNPSSFAVAHNFTAEVTSPGADVNNPSAGRLPSSVYNSPEHTTPDYATPEYAISERITSEYAILKHPISSVRVPGRALIKDLTRTATSCSSKDTSLSYTNLEGANLASGLASDASSACVTALVGERTTSAPMATDSAAVPHSARATRTTYTMNNRSDAHTTRLTLNTHTPQDTQTTHALYAANVAPSPSFTKPAHSQGITSVRLSTKSDTSALLKSDASPTQEEWLLARFLYARENRLRKYYTKKNANGNLDSMCYFPEGSSHSSKFVQKDGKSDKYGHSEGYRGGIPGPHAQRQKPMVDTSNFPFSCAAPTTTITSSCSLTTAPASMSTLIPSVCDTAASTSSSTYSSAHVNTPADTRAARGDTPLMQGRVAVGSAWDQRRGARATLWRSDVAAEEEEWNMHDEYVSPLVLVYAHAAAKSNRREASGRSEEATGSMDNVRRKEQYPSGARVHPAHNASAAGALSSGHDNAGAEAGENIDLRHRASADEPEPEPKPEQEREWEKHEQRENGRVCEQVDAGMSETVDVNELVFEPMKAVIADAYVAQVPCVDDDNFDDNDDNFDANTGGSSDDYANHSPSHGYAASTTTSVFLSLQSKSSHKTTSPSHARAHVVSRKRALPLPRSCKRMCLCACGAWIEGYINREDTWRTLSSEKTLDKLPQSILASDRDLIGESVNQPTLEQTCDYSRTPAREYGWDYGVLERVYSGCTCAHTQAQRGTRATGTGTGADKADVDIGSGAARGDVLLRAVLRSMPYDLHNDPPGNTCDDLQINIPTADAILCTHSMHPTLIRPFAQLPPPTSVKQPITQHPMTQSIAQPIAHVSVAATAFHASASSRAASSCPITHTQVGNSTVQATASVNTNTVMDTNTVSNITSEPVNTELLDTDAGHIHDNAVWGYPGVEVASECDEYNISSDDRADASHNSIDSSSVDAIDDGLLNSVCDKDIREGAAPPLAVISPHIELGSSFFPNSGSNSGYTSVSASVSALTSSSRPCSSWAWSWADIRRVCAAAGGASRVAIALIEVESDGYFPLSPSAVLAEVTRAVRTWVPVHAVLTALLRCPDTCVLTWNGEYTAADTEVDSSTHPGAGIDAAMAIEARVDVQHVDKEAHHKSKVILTQENREAGRSNKGMAVDPALNNTSDGNAPAYCSSPSHYASACSLVGPSWAVLPSPGALQPPTLSRAAALASAAMAFAGCGRALPRILRAVTAKVLLYAIAHPRWFSQLVHLVRLQIQHTRHAVDARYKSQTTRHPQGYYQHQYDQDHHDHCDRQDYHDQRHAMHPHTSQCTAEHTTQASPYGLFPAQASERATDSSTSRSMSSFSSSFPPLLYIVCYLCRQYYTHRAMRVASYGARMHAIETVTRPYDLSLRTLVTHTHKQVIKANKKFFLHPISGNRRIFPGSYWFPTLYRPSSTSSTSTTTSTACIRASPLSSQSLSCTASSHSVLALPPLPTALDRAIAALRHLAEHASSPDACLLTAPEPVFRHCVSLGLLLPAAVVQGVRVLSRHLLAPSTVLFTHAIPLSLRDLLCILIPTERAVKRRAAAALALRSPSAAEACKYAMEAPPGVCTVWLLQLWQIMIVVEANIGGPLKYHMRTQREKITHNSGKQGMQDYGVRENQVFRDDEELFRITQVPVWASTQARKQPPMAPLSTGTAAVLNTTDMNTASVMNTASAPTSVSHVPTSIWSTDGSTFGSNSTVPDPAVALAVTTTDMMSVQTSIDATTENTETANTQTASVTAPNITVSNTRAIDVVTHTSAGAPAATAENCTATPGSPTAGVISAAAPAGGIQAPMGANRVPVRPAAEDNTGNIPAQGSSADSSASTGGSGVDFNVGASPAPAGFSSLLHRLLLRTVQHSLALPHTRMYTHAHARRHASGTAEIDVTASNQRPRAAPRVFVRGDLLDRLAPRQDYRSRTSARLSKYTPESSLQTRQLMSEKDVLSSVKQGAARMPHRRSRYLQGAAKATARVVDSDYDSAYDADYTYDAGGSDHMCPSSRTSGVASGAASDWIWDEGAAALVRRPPKVYAHTTHTQHISKPAREYHTDVSTCVENTDGDTSINTSMKVVAAPADKKDNGSAAASIYADHLNNHVDNLDNDAVSFDHLSDSDDDEPDPSAHIRIQLYRKGSSLRLRRRTWWLELSDSGTDADDSDAYMDATGCISSAEDDDCAVGTSANANASANADVRGAVDAVGAGDGSVGSEGSRLGVDKSGQDVDKQEPDANACDTLPAASTASMSACISPLPSQCSTLRRIILHAPNHNNVTEHPYITNNGVRPYVAMNGAHAYIDHTPTQSYTSHKNMHRNSENNDEYMSGARATVKSLRAPWQDNPEQNLEEVIKKKSYLRQRWLSGDVPAVSSIEYYRYLKWRRRMWRKGHRVALERAVRRQLLYDVRVCLWRKVERESRRLRKVLRGMQQQAGATARRHGDDARDILSGSVRLRTNNAAAAAQAHVHFSAGGNAGSGTEFLHRQRFERSAAGCRAHRDNDANGYGDRDLYSEADSCDNNDSDVDVESETDEDLRIARSSTTQGSLTTRSSMARVRSRHEWVPRRTSATKPHAPSNQANNAPHTSASNSTSSGDSSVSASSCSSPYPSPYCSALPSSAGTGVLPLETAWLVYWRAKIRKYKRVFVENIIHEHRRTQSSTVSTTVSMTSTSNLNINASIVKNDPFVTKRNVVSISSDNISSVPNHGAVSIHKSAYNAVHGPTAASADSVHGDDPAAPLATSRTHTWSSYAIQQAPTRTTPTPTDPFAVIVQLRRLRTQHPLFTSPDPLARGREKTRERLIVRSLMGVLWQWCELEESFGLQRWKSRDGAKKQDEIIRNQAEDVGNLRGAALRNGEESTPMGVKQKDIRRPLFLHTRPFLRMRGAVERKGKGACGGKGNQVGRDDYFHKNDDNKNNSIDNVDKCVHSTSVGAVHTTPRALHRHKHQRETYYQALHVRRGTPRDGHRGACRSDGVESRHAPARSHSRAVAKHGGTRTSGLGNSLGGVHGSGAPTVNSSLAHGITDDILDTDDDFDEEEKTLLRLFCTGEGPASDSEFEYAWATDTEDTESGDEDSATSASTAIGAGAGVGQPETDGDTSHGARTQGESMDRPALACERLPSRAAASPAGSRTTPAALAAVEAIAEVSDVFSLVRAMTLTLQSSNTQSPSASARNGRASGNDLGGSHAGDVALHGDLLRYQGAGLGSGAGGRPVAEELHGGISGDAVGISGVPLLSFNAQTHISTFNHSVASGSIAPAAVSAMDSAEVTFSPMQASLLRRVCQEELLYCMYAHQRCVAVHRTLQMARERREPKVGNAAVGRVTMEAYSTPNIDSNAQPDSTAAASAFLDSNYNSTSGPFMSPFSALYTQPEEASLAHKGPTSSSSLLSSSSISGLMSPSEPLELVLVCLPQPHTPERGETLPHVLLPDARQPHVASLCGGVSSPLESPRMAPVTNIATSTSTDTSTTSSYMSKPLLAHSSLCTYTLVAQNTPTSRGYIWSKDTKRYVLVDNAPICTYCRMTIFTICPYQHCVCHCPCNIKDHVSTIRSHQWKTKRKQRVSMQSPTASVAQSVALIAAFGDPDILPPSIPSITPQPYSPSLASTSSYFSTFAYLSPLTSSTSCTRSLLSTSSATSGAPAFPRAYITAMARFIEHAAIQFKRNTALQGKPNAALSIQRHRDGQAAKLDVPSEATTTTTRTTAHTRANTTINANMNTNMDSDTAHGIKDTAHACNPDNIDVGVTNGENATLMHASTSSTSYLNSSPAHQFLSMSPSRRLELLLAPDVSTLSACIRSLALFFTPRAGSPMHVLAHCGPERVARVLRRQIMGREEEEEAQTQADVHVHAHAQTNADAQSEVEVEVGVEVPVTWSNELGSTRSISIDADVIQTGAKVTCAPNAAYSNTTADMTNAGSADTRDNKDSQDNTYGEYTLAGGGSSGVDGSVDNSGVSSANIDANGAIVKNTGSADTSGAYATGTNAAVVIDGVIDGGVDAVDASTASLVPATRLTAGSNSTPTSSADSTTDIESDSALACLSLSRVLPLTALAARACSVLLSSATLSASTTPLMLARPLAPIELMLVSRMLKFIASACFTPDLMASLNLNLNSHAHDNTRTTGATHDMSTPTAPTISAMSSIDSNSTNTNTRDMLIPPSTSPDASLHTLNSPLFRHTHTVPTSSAPGLSTAQTQSLPADSQHYALCAALVHAATGTQANTSSLQLAQARPRTHVNGSLHIQATHNGVDPAVSSSAGGFAAGDSHAGSNTLASVDTAASQESTSRLQSQSMGVALPSTLPSSIPSAVGASLLHALMLPHETSLEGLGVWDNVLQTHTSAQAYTQAPTDMHAHTDAPTRSCQGFLSESSSSSQSSSFSQLAASLPYYKQCILPNHRYLLPHPNKVLPLLEHTLSPAALCLYMHITRNDTIPKIATVLPQVAALRKKYHNLSLFLKTFSQHVQRHSVPTPEELSLTTRAISLAPSLFDWSFLPLSLCVPPPDALIVATESSVESILSTAGTAQTGATSTTTPGAAATSSTFVKAAAPIATAAAASSAASSASIVGTRVRQGLDSTAGLGTATGVSATIQGSNAAASARNRGTAILTSSYTRGGSSGHDSGDVHMRNSGTSTGGGGNDTAPNTTNANGAGKTALTNDNTSKPHRTGSFASTHRHADAGPGHTPLLNIAAALHASMHDPYAALSAAAVYGVERNIGHIHDIIAANSDTNINQSANSCTSYGNDVDFTGTDSYNQVYSPNQMSFNNGHVPGLSATSPNAVGLRCQYCLNSARSTGIVPVVSASSTSGMDNLTATTDLSLKPGFAPNSSNALHIYRALPLPSDTATSSVSVVSTATCASFQAPLALHSTLVSPTVLAQVMDTTGLWLRGLSPGMADGTRVLLPVHVAAIKTLVAGSSGCDGGLDSDAAKGEHTPAVCICGRSLTQKHSENPHRSGKTSPSESEKSREDSIFPPESAISSLSASWAPLAASAAWSALLGHWAIRDTYTWHEDLRRLGMWSSSSSSNKSSVCNNNSGGGAVDITVNEVNVSTTNTSPGTSTGLGTHSRPVQDTSTHRADSNVADDDAAGSVPDGMPGEEDVWEGNVLWDVTLREWVKTRKEAAESTSMVSTNTLAAAAADTSTSASALLMQPANTTPITTSAHLASGTYSSLASTSTATTSTNTTISTSSAAPPALLLQRSSPRMSAHIQARSNLIAPGSQFHSPPAIRPSLSNTTVRPSPQHPNFRNYTTRESGNLNSGHVNPNVKPSPYAPPALPLPSPLPPISWTSALSSTFLARYGACSLSSLTSLPTHVPRTLFSFMDVRVPLSPASMISLAHALQPPPFVRATDTQYAQILVAPVPILLLRALAASHMSFSSPVHLIHRLPLLRIYMHTLCSENTAQYLAEYLHAATHTATHTVAQYRAPHPSPDPDIRDIHAPSPLLLARASSPTIVLPVHAHPHMHNTTNTSTSMSTHPRQSTISTVSSVLPTHTSLASSTLLPMPSRHSTSLSSHLAIVSPASMSLGSPAGMSLLSPGQRYNQTQARSSGLMVTSPHLHTQTQSYTQANAQNNSIDNANMGMTNNHINGNLQIPDSQWSNDTQRSSIFASPTMSGMSGIRNSQFKNSQSGFIPVSPLMVPVSSHSSPSFTGIRPRSSVYMHANTRNSTNNSGGGITSPFSSPLAPLATAPTVAPLSTLAQSSITSVFPLSMLSLLAVACGSADAVITHLHLYLVAHTSLPTTMPQTLPGTYSNAYMNAGVHPSPQSSQHGLAPHTPRFPPSTPTLASRGSVANYLLSPAANPHAHAHASSAGVLSSPVHTNTYSHLTMGSPVLALPPASTHSQQNFRGSVARTPNLPQSHHMPMQARLDTHTAGRAVSAYAIQVDDPSSSNTNGNVNGVASEYRLAASLTRPSLHSTSVSGSASGAASAALLSPSGSTTTSARGSILISPNRSRSLHSTSPSAPRSSVLSPLVHRPSILQRNAPSQPQASPLMDASFTVSILSEACLLMQTTVKRICWLLNSTSLPIIAAHYAYQRYRASLHPRTAARWPVLSPVAPYPFPTLPTPSSVYSTSSAYSAPPASSLSSATTSPPYYSASRPLSSTPSSSAYAFASSIDVLDSTSLSSSPQSVLPRAHRIIYPHEAFALCVNSGAGVYTAQLLEAVLCATILDITALAHCRLSVPTMLLQHCAAGHQVRESGNNTGDIRVSRRSGDMYNTSPDYASKYSIYGNDSSSRRGNASFYGNVPQTPEHSQFPPRNLPSSIGNMHAKPPLGDIGVTNVRPGATSSSSAIFGAGTGVGTSPACPYHDTHSRLEQARWLHVERIVRETIQDGHDVHGDIGSNGHTGSSSGSAGAERAAIHSVHGDAHSSAPPHPHTHLYMHADKPTHVHTYTSVHVTDGAANPSSLFATATKPGLVQTSAPVSTLLSALECEREQMHAPSPSQTHTRPQTQAQTQAQAQAQAQAQLRGQAHVSTHPSTCLPRCQCQPLVYGCPWSVNELAAGVASALDLFMDENCSLGLPERHPGKSLPQQENKNSGFTAKPEFRRDSDASIGSTSTPLPTRLAHSASTTTSSSTSSSTPQRRKRRLEPFGFWSEYVCSAMEGTLAALHKEGGGVSTDASGGTEGAAAAAARGDRSLGRGGDGLARSRSSAAEHATIDTTRETNGLGTSLGTGLGLGHSNERALARETVAVNAVEASPPMHSAMSRTPLFSMSMSTSTSALPAFPALAPASTFLSPISTAAANAPSQPLASYFSSPPQQQPMKGSLANNVNTGTSTNSSINTATTMNSTTTGRSTPSLPSDMPLPPCGVHLPLLRARYPLSMAREAYRMLTGMCATVRRAADSDHASGTANGTAGGTAGGAGFSPAGLLPSECPLLSPRDDLARELQRAPHIAAHLPLSPRFFRYWSPCALDARLLQASALPHWRAGDTALKQRWVHERKNMKEQMCVALQEGYQRAMLRYNICVQIAINDAVYKEQLLLRPWKILEAFLNNAQMGKIPGDGKFPGEFVLGRTITAFDRSQVNVHMQMHAQSGVLSVYGGTPQFSVGGLGSLGNNNGETNPDNSHSGDNSVGGGSIGAAAPASPQLPRSTTLPLSAARSPASPTSLKAGHTTDSASICSAIALKAPVLLCLSPFDARRVRAALASALAAQQTRARLESRRAAQQVHYQLLGAVKARQSDELTGTTTATRGGITQGAASTGQVPGKTYGGHIGAKTELRNAASDAQHGGRVAISGRYSGGSAIHGPVGLSRAREDRDHGKEGQCHCSCGHKPTSVAGASTKGGMVMTGGGGIGAKAKNQTCNCPCHGDDHDAVAVPLPGAPKWVWCIYVRENPESRKMKLEQGFLPSTILHALNGVPRIYVPPVYGGLPLAALEPY